MTRLWKPDEQLPVPQEIHEKKPLRRWTPGEVPKPSENIFRSLGTGFETAMSEPAAGILQLLGTPDLAKSVHDYWAKAYEKSKKINPGFSMTGYGTGAVTPSLAVPFGGPAGLVGKIALGAGIGGAQGALNYVPDNDIVNRLSNALQGAGIGAAASGIGSAIQAVPKIIKAFPITEKGLTKRAGEILGKRQEMENMANKLYQEPTAIATEAGVTLGNPKSFIHKKDINFIMEQVSPNRARSFKSYLENPDLSFKEGHDLYKFLGDTSRKLSSNRNIDKNVFETISEIQNTLTKKMDSSLIKNGLREEAGKIKEANKFYQENVLPYRNPIIETYKQGKTRPKEFLDELAKLGKYKKETNLAEEFLSEKGKKHPWLLTREAVSPYVKWGTRGAGILGGGGLLKHYLE